MVAPAEGGQPVAVSSGPHDHQYPVWGANSLDLFFGSNQSGQWATWVASRDSVGGAWRDAVKFIDEPFLSGTAPDGGGMLQILPLTLYSREGRVLWRRDLEATSRLTIQSEARYSRRGSEVYAVGARDGRRGVWAIPIPHGEPRLVIAFDDRVLSVFEWVSVGPDRLYLTVAEYESDIWVARLRW
jgi:hypothetical protein